MVYDTYKAAAEAVHLLSSDTVWQDTLREAATYQMLSQLRHLFATICLYCNPIRPLDLWENNLHDFIEDYLRYDPEHLSIEKALLDVKIEKREDIVLRELNR